MRTPSRERTVTLRSMRQAFSRVSEKSAAAEFSCHDD